METKLEDALRGEETQPEAVEEVTEAVDQVEEKSEDQPRDESGRFAAKEKGVEQQEEAQADVPAPSEPPSDTTDGLPKEVYEPLKAVRSENRELKQQIAALQQQFAQTQTTESPPEFWDDPDGAIEARITQATEVAIQRYQQQQVLERIETSETAAKAKYADYGDAFAAFQQAASLNPGLVDQMRTAPDPGEFAYSTGKRAMDLDKVGSIDELLKSERAKWENEVKAKAPAPKLPATTATDGSVGSRTGPDWSGPADLSSLLPNS